MSAGVYTIKCKRTRYKYVGSSARSIENRFSVHAALLKCGSHHSKKMQRDWDKYGAVAFEFSIVLLCASSQVISEEQKLLDRGGKLYNTHASATSAEGVKRSKETRQLMSARSKERNARPEHKEILRKRAKRQHEEGKLGRQTWGFEAEVAFAKGIESRARKHSEKIKSMWEDPNFRQKISAARWTPKRRAEQAERIRQLNRTKYPGV